MSSRTSCAFGLFASLVFLAMTTMPFSGLSAEPPSSNRAGADRLGASVKSVAGQASDKNEHSAVEQAVAEQRHRSRPEIKPTSNTVGAAVARVPHVADQSQIIDLLRNGRPTGQSCDDILLRAQLGELGAEDFGALKRCR